MRWEETRWNYKNDTIRQDNISNNTIHCRCGHSLVFKASDDKLLCDWCGRVVRNTTKAHFLYKLQKPKKYTIIRLEGDE